MGTAKVILYAKWAVYAIVDTGPAGGFDDDYYCSSSERNEITAWYHRFVSGSGL